jgi:hypothetical protein
MESAKPKPKGMAAYTKQWVKMINNPMAIQGIDFANEAGVDISEIPDKYAERVLSMIPKIINERPTEATKVYYNSDGTIGHRIHNDGYTLKLSDEQKQAIKDHIDIYSTEFKGYPEALRKHEDVLIESSRQSFEEEKAALKGKEEADEFYKQLKKSEEKHDDELKKSVRDEYAGMTPDQVIAYYAAKHNSPDVKGSGKNAIDQMDDEINQRAASALGKNYSDEKGLY